MATATEARKATKRTPKKAAKRTPRKAAKKAAPRKATTAKVAKKTRVPRTPETIRMTTIGRQIGAYLSEIRERGDDARGRPTMDRWTPPKIEAAIKRAEAKVRAATTPIAELKLRSYVIEMRGLLDAALAVNGTTRPVDAFVKHGAEYAIHNRIPYQAFRDMGVPASVLKRAGIRK